MNDAINRKDTIGAILSIEHIAELSDGDAVIRVSAVNYVLRNLPSADVQPVRHGHWTLQEDRTKKLYGWHICSECGAWIGEPTNYCSNCGADMRGKQNETD